MDLTVLGCRTRPCEYIVAANKSSIRKPWTREELLLAMHLYCRIPFGRQNGTSPEVIELAAVLHRTPGSVAMKLCNFTSLDPEEAERGVIGLQGASNLDRQIWSEFHANWVKLAEESEQLWQLRVLQNVEKTATSTAVDPEIVESKQGEFSGQTERLVATKIRLAQVFFRRVVLSSYRMRCCISGCPVPDLLIASHIVPWSVSVEHRANPYNGLCLSRIHDGAFDRGLISFDEKRRLILSKKLKAYLPCDSLRQNFAVFEGQVLQTPERFTPHHAFLEHHRENIFCG